MMRMIKVLTTSMLMLCSITTMAQNDSLIFKNNNVIVGEIKSMERGILTIKTPYSDSDFKIEWENIKEIYISYTTEWPAIKGIVQFFTKNYSPVHAGKYQTAINCYLGEKSIAITLIEK